MLLLIIYVLVALIFSFICSIMEAVLLSVTPSFIAAMEPNSPSTCARFRQLKNNIDRPLAAILSLNTIAHTIGAAGAGAQAAVIFGSMYVGLASAVLTLLILVLSEIIPKTLGALYWRRLSRVVAFSLHYLIWIMAPFVWMSMGITRLIARGRKPHIFSREEFKAMAELGVKAGVIEEQESHFLQNLLRFKSLRAKDIMTPRTVLFAVQENSSVDQALQDNPDIIFSRILIFKQNLDEIDGYVMKSEVLLCSATGNRETPLIDLKRDIITVPETMSLSHLLESFLNRREHIALVVDEYGGTAGIVTMEDIVETLLGLEIMDEVDTIEDMQALARTQWEKRAQNMMGNQSQGHPGNEKAEK